MKMNKKFQELMQPVKRCSCPGTCRKRSTLTEVQLHQLLTFEFLSNDGIIVTD